MGVGIAIAIAINIFLLFFIGVIFYITFLAFNKRSARNESILDIIKRTWSSQKSVEQAIKGPVYGDLGSFVGYDDQGIDMYTIGDTQDNVMDFMNQLKPDRIGT